MKKIACILFSAAVLAACHSNTVEILPKPVSVEEGKGRVELGRELTFNVGSPEHRDLISVWGETFAPIARAVEPKTKMRADVLLLVDESLEAEEYRLEIADAPNKVVISGGSPAGVWWGAQTFAQILVQNRTADGFDLPCVKVSDKPLFAYRGGMLDCCRHFFTVEEVKKFIDILALHKLNVFHWHLTEDQGWRIEIKKYPRLTEIGSVRKETLVGHHKQSTEYDGVPHGGFYTQEEIRDIVKYAADRQITIIPEIEMPGHSLAALASYPELGCVGKGYEVSTGWGIFPDIYCAGNDKTLQFLKDVLDEVCELFPSEYIHIGGDEAPTTRWEECPKCQAKKAELGLEKTEYLHGYMLRAIEEHLNDKGRKIIGWDEVLDADVTQTATIMSWRGPSGGIRAAKQGNHVIMSPNTHYYLDYYQTEDPEANGEPLGIGKYIPLSKTYEFEPFDQLDEEQKQYITGVQANLWTEYIAAFDHAQTMVLPRYCGLSEVAWGSAREDYASFRRRVIDVMVPLYKALGLSYAKYGLEDESDGGIEEIAELVFGRAEAQFSLLDSNLDAAEAALAEASAGKAGSNGSDVTSPEKLYPRTLNDDGSLIPNNCKWWCSGFFPGSMWYVYEYTGNERWKELALKYTMPLEQLKTRTNHHDIGFQLMSSFGQGLRLTGNRDFEEVLTTGAVSLAKRFNPTVGCTQSWDNRKWTFPVIIDNMMNLELLFTGAALSGDESLRDIAVRHSETTMKNHFREDYSTWHLVDYDPEDGHILGKQTVQGYADSSAWSRGQAWGLYGYTMVYRFTKDKRFREQAVHIADYLIPRLPEDGVPYWDYDAPDISNEERDASAGAVTASALLELSGYVNAKKAAEYKGVAEKIIRTLASKEYLAEDGEIQGFLLKHSVGNKPGNSEVDVPLTYADYYFLEAIMRCLALNK